MKCYFRTLILTFQKSTFEKKKRFISVCKSHASVKLSLAAKYGNGPPAHIVM